MNTQLNKLSSIEFENFAKKIFNELTLDESLTLTLSAEQTMFARLSKAKVRQMTHLNQAYIEYNFIKGNKTLNFVLPFKSEEDDFSRLVLKLKESRNWMSFIPEDPYLVRPENYGISKDEHVQEFPDNELMLSNILELSQDLDLAGLFTSGIIIRATINSIGQFHWFKTNNFVLDYSIYNDKQKAVKSLIASSNWDLDEIKLNLMESEKRIELMNRPSKKIDRGGYRVFLAPSAVSELLSILSWGGVSMGAHQRGNGSLKDLWEKKKKLSPKFNLIEDFTLNMGPRFNSRGEVAPLRLSIIENGNLENFLTSTRSSNEYKVETNFATEGESLRSAVILPGKLDRDNILKELGTGLYLSDLHYLNWSDRETARITGMTRYACFWVEDGEIICPIEDLRFDESLYSLFGDALVDLTSYTENIPNTGSYFEREVGGTKVPGVLISQFKFTL